MNIINGLSKFFLSLTTHTVDPDDSQMYQENFLMTIIKKNKKTLYGNKYNFSTIQSIQDFQKQVPIVQYNDIESHIHETMRGKKDILVKGTVDLFARTSGTTPGQIKYIPTTKQCLKENHFAAATQSLKWYIKDNGISKLFPGKSIMLGGGFFKNPFANKENVGYISSILHEQAPIWSKVTNAIPKDITFINNREEKVFKIVNATKDKNITSIGGLPNRILDFLTQASKYTQKQYIKDIRPNIECLFVGGTNYRPYKQQLQDICGKDITIREVYNASEGFIATQMSKKDEDMLLLTKQGIFFEFIDMDTFHNETPKVYTLDQVEVNKNYALVITTLSGLYRYVIGDTIRFTNTNPHKIQITGRTKTYIATFGENVLVDHTDRAIQKACEEHKVQIVEYTVAPILFYNQKSMGAHERHIEFKKSPKDIRSFTQTLDTTMKSVNDYYDRRRQNDAIIGMPIVRVMKSGTFYKRLKSKGKLGHQNKIPRLSNTRDFVEELEQYYK